MTKDESERAIEAARKHDTQHYSSDPRLKDARAAQVYREAAELAKAGRRLTWGSG